MAVHEVRLQLTMDWKMKWPPGQTSEKSYILVTQLVTNAIQNTVSAILIGIRLLLRVFLVAAYPMWRSWVDIGQFLTLGYPIDVHL